MDKTPKLNLETPDMSKAKLPLGEESVSVKIDPKLKLGSEPIGLAQKLVLDLEKAYENPAIKAYMQAEEDRKALIQASIEQWNEPSLQTKIHEYAKLITNPTYSVALEKPNSVQDYAAKISEAISGKNYEYAKKVLEDFNPQMNSAYAAAQSAVEQFRKTLENSSIKNSIAHLENLGIYESNLAKASTSIANNKDMFKASQRLNEIGKSILNDSFKQRMNEHNIANLKKNHIDIPPPPKNHLLEHTARIADQNDQLIETTKLQNNILNDIAEYMRMQSEYAELQNENIEYQIEQKEFEIEGNKKSASLSFWIAVASIGISVIVSAMSWWATYDVYHKEDISGQKDHQELLQAIKESSNTVKLAKELQYQKDANAIQQQQMIRLNQEVEQMKIYLNGNRQ